MSFPSLRRFYRGVSLPTCGALTLLAGLLLAAEAQAQTVVPPTSGVFAPEPPPMPMRPLPYSPFGYYDLLAGFRPVYLGAPQPTGHQIVATSRNGYIYRPVYDPPPGTAVPPGIPVPAGANLQLPASTAGYSPPTAAPPAQAPELQAAVQDFQAGRYETALKQLQLITAADANNGFAWLLASHAQFALEHFAESSTSLRRALTLLPENEWGQILDRYRDYYRATRYTTHLRSLENFVAAHPAESATHLLLGYHYGSLGYRPQAIAQLQRAAVDKIDRLLLAHFGGQPASATPMVPRLDAPPPAPETLEPPAAAGLPRAF